MSDHVRLEVDADVLKTVLDDVMELCDIVAETLDAETAVRYERARRQLVADADELILRVPV